MQDEPRTWRYAPAPPPLAPRRTLPWHLLEPVGAVMVGVVGPTVRTLMISPAPGPVVVGAAGLAALSVASRSRDESAGWWRRLVVVALAAAVSVPFGGAWVGAWLMVSIPLALWVFADLPPHPALPHSQDPAPLVVVATSVVATLEGRAVVQRQLPVALTVLSAVLVLVAARYGDRVRTALASIGGLVATAVSTVLFGLFAQLVVILPWLIQRLAFVDPLASPARAGTQWVSRERSRVGPSRPWSEPRLERRPGRSAFRTLRASLATIVVLAPAVWVGIAWTREDRVEEVAIRPAAFAGDAWWFDYLEQMNWALFDPGISYNPLRYPRPREVHTPYVNVENGERRSWMPPACSCRPIRVWLYGASTMMGMGQRDDHTIPSELARLAHADGLTLEVHNRGVLGDLHWEEAQRFAWDVEVEEPPDVVVFYSGSNDLLGTEERQASGHGLDGDPVDWTAEDAVPRDRLSSGEITEHDGRWVAPALPDVAPLAPDAFGTYVQEQYLRSRDMAATTAGAHSVPAFWFWQPTRFTRPPEPGEPQKPEDEERYRRAAAVAAADELPPGVDDLSDVFDDVDAPIYFDDVHTNERGAAIVAAAMYARLKPGLVALGPR